MHIDGYVEPTKEVKMSVIFTKDVRVGNKRSKVSVECFNSADECARECEKRSITSSSFDDMRKKARANWHGATYGEAMNLLKNGYQATVEALRNVFNASVGTGKRFRFNNNVIGFAPVVPLALMGVPNSMIDMHMTPIKAKVVDVYFDMTCRCSTTSEQIMEASKKILSAVIELERQGYRFNLYSCTSFFNSTSGDIMCIKVKSAEQPLDLKRISFSMAHTAFFRVLGFDWYSKFPIGTYRGGYGHAAYFEFEKGGVQDMYKQVFGKSNIVFFSAQQMIDRGNDVKTIKEILENNSNNNSKKEGAR